MIPKGPYVLPVLMRLRVLQECTVAKGLELPIAAGVSIRAL